MILKKQKVFRSHIIAVVGGRVLLIFSLYPFCSMLYAIIKLVIIDQIKTGIFRIGETLLFLFGFLGFCFAYSFLCKMFWQISWCKLIITEDNKIIWKCLFNKSIVLAVNDVKYSKPCSFMDGNYLKDVGIYQNSFEYVLLSSNPIPNKRIDKIQSKGMLIKFMLNDELCDTLGKILPNGGTFRAISRKRGKRKNFWENLKTIFK